MQARKFRAYPNLERLDIRAVLNRLGVRVKGESGGWITAWCIFHADGDNPNLRVHPDGGVFRCFSCGASGNILHLVEQALGVDREGAWLFLGEMEHHAPTIGQIRRKLESRDERAVVGWVELLEKKLDDVSRLGFTISPGERTSIWLAEQECDFVRWVDLVDENYYIITNAVDYAMAIVESEYLPRLRAGELASFYYAVEEINSVWKLAELLGYIADHPLVWQQGGLVRVTSISDYIPKELCA